MVDLLAHLPPMGTLTDWEREGAEVARAGRAVAYDIRDEEGAASIHETVRAKLKAGVIVCMWDSAEVMPPFAIAPASAAYLVIAGDEVRGSFADPIAALKHGLTMWQGGACGR